MVVLPPPSTVIPFPVTVPLDAELTAFCTSLCEQVAALMVVAWAGRHQHKTRATMICILIEDHLGTLQEQRVAAIPSFERNKPEYPSISASGKGIASKHRPRLLPALDFPRSDFSPEISSVPRAFILTLLATPAPYSVSFQET